jgi:hypothetical protein
VETSVLETEIIRAAQAVSWYAGLWFPVVQRQLLNIHVDATDEQLHAAVVSLIEKHSLVPINPYLPYSWEIADLNDIAQPDPSLRRISTPANSVRCLGNALSSHEWVDEMPVAVRGLGRESGIESLLDINYLESQIILAIDNKGWFPFLWFPIVDHDALNFGSPAPDDYVHRAFPSLIRKRALIPIHEEPGDEPEWRPEPNAFKTAVYKALGRRI